MLPAFWMTILLVVVSGTPGAKFVRLKPASQFEFALSSEAAVPEKQAEAEFTVLFIVSVPDATELLSFAVSAEKFANVPPIAAAILVARGAGDFADGLLRAADRRLALAGPGRVSSR